MRHRIILLLVILLAILLFVNLPSQGLSLQVYQISNRGEINPVRGPRYGFCLNLQGDGSANNWGGNLFMTNEAVRNLTKEAGVKVIEVGSARTLDDLAYVCKLVRQIGAEPLIGLPQRYWVSNPLEQSVAIVTKLGNLCNLYEIGNEPNNPKFEMTPEEYATNWREIVTACRKINPNAKYGGPVASVPWAYWGYVTPVSKYYQVFLKSNKDLLRPENSFLSFHHYTTYYEELVNKALTQADLIDRARTVFARAINELNSMMDTLLGYRLPIALTEFNWIASDSDGGRRWDLDEAFMKGWTKTAMTSMEQSGLWLGQIWKLIRRSSVDTANSILSIINDVGEPKPQYYAFKEVVAG